MAHEDGRVLLENGFVVTRYELELTPDLVAFTFAGVCVMHVQVTNGAATQVVKVHAKELLIASVVYTAAAAAAGGSGGEGQGGAGAPLQLASESITLDAAATEATIHFAHPLPTGSGSFRFTFTGLLNGDMAGFYRSHYTDRNGEKKVMASTQFEALDARRAFPCIDEPAAKAVFGLSLIVPANLSVLSNMPEAGVQEIPDKGLKHVRFQDTPKMSTYLLAFLVGEFDYVEASTQHGVRIRVYTPPGRAEHGRFSLDCGCRALDLYDDFFGVPYPLPKLDMIAIPEFAAGAMENWGLVTYREIELLIDAARATPQQQQRVCIVVTHELAHQWFGNLVTMGWWCDLWLNEGFASFMENFSADLLFPHWRIWDQFAADTLASALELDALATSHPIQIPIAHAEEVEEVFDSISYSKGACVVRMAHEVLGRDAFRAGLQLYMKRHAYGNTETKDLWVALGEASGLPVEKMMQSWTLQMGFPLLSVVKEEWTEDGVVLTIKQSWFLSDGSAAFRYPKPLWTVPVVWGTSSKAGASCQLFDTEEVVVKIPLAGHNAASWMKLNLGHVAPLRVAYTSSLLGRLCEGIKSKTLPAVDRAGLLLDIYALCKAGVHEGEELFRVLGAFVHEDDATVWQAVETVVGQLDHVLRATSSADGLALYARFQAFVSRLVTPAMALAGWESLPTDDHLGKMRRTSVMSLAGAYSQDASVAVTAKGYFQRICADPADNSACPNELRTTILKIAARNGGAAERAELLRIYGLCKSDADRKAVMLAVGYVPGKELQEATMHWALSGGDVKLQDCFYPFFSVAAGSFEGQQCCWAFFRENYAAIYAKVGNSHPHMMESFIEAATGSYAEEAAAAAVQAFFQDKDLPSNQRFIAQTIENIRANTAFVGRLRTGAVQAADFFDNL